MAGFGARRCTVVAPLSGFSLFISTPGRIRTCDLRIRSPLLYPAELRGPRGPLWSRSVGAAGFEPATFRPQTERATRLRHAPTEDKYGGALRTRALEQRWEEPCRSQARRGDAPRGGHGVHVVHAPATASWSCPRSWPSRPRRRLGGRGFRARPGRGRALLRRRCAARPGGQATTCATRRCA